MNNMYIISKLTGNIYHNNVFVPQDDRVKSWLDFNVFLKNGGIVTEIEYTTEEIVEQENLQKQELKKQQHEELLPTDWYVIRFIERGIAIPEEIKTQRQAILDKYSI